MQGRKYFINRFKFIAAALTTLHEVEEEHSRERYHLAVELAHHNQFDVNYDYLHKHLFAAENDMQTYNLTFQQAVVYNHLKQAVKQHFLFDKGKRRDRKLIDYSDEFNKDLFVQLGIAAGLSEKEIAEVLPAFALKFTHNEIQFIEKAFYRGFFGKPSEYITALKEVDGKYEKRFHL